MKLNRTSIVLPLASLLVVAGASVVLATSGPAPAANDTTVVPAAESASPSASAKTTIKPKDTALTEVLDDLVAKGTITESQKQAVLDGVAAERAARQAERKAAREAAKANRQQLRTFLEDGVITQEEFDQLPADSALRQATDLMADGKITTEELKALGRGFGFGFGRGGHGHGGWKFLPNGTSPDASASPSTSS
jgi:polyhydroxyalkanoate synthesis regulator phasin